MSQSAERLIKVGSRVPRRRRGILPFLGLLFLRLSGWRVRGELPDIPRAVLIAAPHTSFWDAVFGFAAIEAQRVKLNLLVKDVFFFWPLGWILKKMGGLPVRTETPEGTVEQATERFQSREKLFLAMAPEGTRMAPERWRTGFHHIARFAGVPIILVGLDYARREVRVLETLDPGDDQEADLQRIYNAFRSVAPRNPDWLSGPLR